MSGQVAVTVEDCVVWRNAGQQRTKVGSVYPTTRGWQSSGRFFVSRFCKSRQAAVRELLADQGYDPAEAPR